MQPVPAAAGAAGARTRFTLDANGWLIQAIGLIHFFLHIESERFTLRRGKDMTALEQELK